MTCVWVVCGSFLFGCVFVGLLFVEKKPNDFFLIYKTKFAIHRTVFVLFGKSKYMLVLIYLYVNNVNDLKAPVFCDHEWLCRCASFRSAGGQLVLRVVGDEGAGIIQKKG